MRYFDFPQVYEQMKNKNQGETSSPFLPHICHLYIAWQGMIDVTPIPQDQK